MTPNVSFTKVNDQQIATMMVADTIARINVDEGANLFELSESGKNIDVLVSSDNPSERVLDFPFFGTPILFPPNRISGGTFSYEGNEYHFPINDQGGRPNYIHGVLYFEKFSVSGVDIGENSCSVKVRYDSSEESDFFTYFPHLFTVELDYTLTKNGIKKEICIKNTGDKALPCCLGFHTFIKVPYSKSGDKNSCSMCVTVGKEWPMDENYIPTGEKTELRPEHKGLIEGGFPLYGRAISNHFTASPIERDGKLFNGAVISDTSANEKLIYEVGPEFGHWMLWNGNSVDGFICPEPQTIVVDAMNMKDYRNDTGFLGLQPGECFATYEKLYWE